MARICESSIFPAVFGLLVATFLLQHATSYKVTLGDLLLGKYFPAYFGGVWLPVDNQFGFESDGNLVAFDAVTNTTRVVVDGAQFDNIQFPGRRLSLSVDNQFVLITHSARSIMELYPLAKYNIYDRLNNRTYPLNPPGHSGSDPQAELELAIWSPTGSALAYVYQRNVYYLSSVAQGTLPRQITFDGNETVSNGRITWVFADDIFGTGNTMGFSPDGSHLAYVRFDETPVQQYMFNTYGEPGEHTEYLYPKVESIPFPKAGTPNGEGSLHVVSLSNPTLQPYELTYPSDVDPVHLHYVGTAHWLSSRELVVVWINRRQQLSNWFTCTANAVTPQPCTHIWSEHEPNGWINMDQIRASFDGTAMLTPSNAMTPGATKSYRHIIKLTLNTTGGGPAQEEHLDPVLYNGTRVHLDDILGWDEDSSTVYFTGNTEVDASEMHVFQLRNETSGMSVDCLTCSLRNSHGESCRWNEASFSPARLSYMFHSCLGPGIPEFAIRDVRNNMTVVRVFEDNSAFRAMLEDAELPSQQNYEIPLASGFTARARLFLPPDFNPAETYPLVVEVYAGPETQFNTYLFELSWFASLTSDRNVLYARIDGSGSSRRSREEYFRLNNRLGTIEVEDQIEATRWLIQTTGIIDPERTAIWGWSNGGYVTSMVMAKDTERVFKCGIAKAPATSFFYTSTVSEKYMGLPTEEDNLGNYTAGDVSLLVEGFRGKEFLLIHGTGDVNAHYQHSMKLLRALQQAGILFNALSYPDELHAIGGRGMTSHQYHMFERFLFRDCFGSVQTTLPTTQAAVTCELPEMTTSMTSASYNFHSYSRWSFFVVVATLVKGVLRAVVEA